MEKVLEEVRIGYSGDTGKKESSRSSTSGVMVQEWDSKAWQA